MVEDIDLHVIGKTESWANIHLQDAELVHTGYVMLRRSRIGRGGVILYVKESIQADEIKLEREADYNEAYLMTLSGLFAHWEHGPSTMVLHPCLFVQWEHRPSTMVLHPCLFVVKKIPFLSRCISSSFFHFGVSLPDISSLSSFFFPWFP